MRKIFLTIILIVSAVIPLVLIIAGTILSVGAKNFLPLLWFFLSALGSVLVCGIVYFIILSLFEISESLQDINKTLKIANKIDSLPTTSTTQSKTSSESNQRANEYYKKKGNTYCPNCKHDVCELQCSIYDIKPFTRGLDSCDSFEPKSK